MPEARGQDSLRALVERRRAARREREVAHTCHWPGCPKEVPPKLWGCKEHWFKLPKALRDRIWATYVPGQEITKTPSDAYLEAAGAVRAWILNSEKVKSSEVQEKKQ